jgi:hypothetical protein
MIASQRFPKHEIIEVTRTSEEIRKFRKYLNFIELEKIRQEESSPKSPKAHQTELKLEPTEWQFPSSTKVAWKYTDVRFILVSNISSELTRQVASRVAEIFKLYEHCFKPEPNVRHKVPIYLFHSSEEYRQASVNSNLVEGKSAALSFYWPEKNHLLVACELPLYKEEVAKIKQYQDELHRETEKQNNKIFGLAKEVEDKKKVASSEPEKKQFKAWLKKQIEIRKKYTKELEKLKEKIAFCEYRQKVALDRVSGETLSALYNAAFYAFCQNFLSPEIKNAPSWLRDGLAQFFEAASLEGNSLVIHTSDSKRIRMIKQVIGEGKTIPLSQFLVAGSKGPISTDGNLSIYYLESWAIVSYLAKSYDLLQGNFLADYAKEIGKRTAPDIAFQKLTQKTLGDFEKAWKEAMSKD